LAALPEAVVTYVPAFFSVRTELIPAKTRSVSPPTSPAAVNPLLSSEI
jgi:hypothetical protein